MTEDELYWVQERADVLRRFTMELEKATGDGSAKRQSGEKPPWYRDKSHMAAVWSHFRKRELGELVDPDSKAHPYVHAAWRLLAIACTENGNNPDAESDKTKAQRYIDAMTEEEPLDYVPEGNDNWGINLSTSLVSLPDQALDTNEKRRLRLIQAESDVQLMMGIIDSQANQIEELEVALDGRKADIENLKVQRDLAEDELAKAEKQIDALDRDNKRLHAMMGRFAT